MHPARLLIALVALATLVSCADDDGGSDPRGGGGLEGVTWILDDASVAAFSDDAPDGARATIRFEGENVGGSAFCNQYGGTYEANDDGSMSIQMGAMTEMACQEPLMSMETSYVAALGEVTGYSLGEDTLSLTRSEGAALSFTAEQPLPLEGTAWRLDGIATGTDAVSSTIAGTEVTATFAGDGTVSGSGGCNRYNGPFTVDGDSIEIGPVASTKMACEAQVSDQEAAYLAALDEAATFEIQGSTLTLLGADGGFLLSFVAT